MLETMLLASTYPARLVIEGDVCTSTGHSPSEYKALLEDCESCRGCPVWQLRQELLDCWRLLMQHHRQLYPDLPLPVPLQCMHNNAYSSKGYQESLACCHAALSIALS